MIPKTLRRLAPLLLLAPLLAACSASRFVENRAASTLDDIASSFARDGDPELVKDALPFALKTIEGLIYSSEKKGKPPSSTLLLAACSGFTQYTYAFVETEAFLIEEEDFRRSRELDDRALKLYLRANGYCQGGLEKVAPGIGKELLLEPSSAAARLGAEDIDLLFWSAASWGAAISLGQDRPDLTANLPAVRALLNRGLELDESYGKGVLHQAMVPLASLPATMGGSEAEARRHFQRAQELSGGRSVGAYVTLARSVAVANQDRDEFLSLLDEALAIDVDEEPSLRLANVIGQRQARELQKRVDDLFFGEESEEVEQESP